jgi:hypothetical protein
MLHEAGWASDAVNDVEMRDCEASTCPSPLEY